MTDGRQHNLVVFEGNWPHSASTDAKYWIRREAAQYIVAARDRQGNRETWHPSTEAHSRLIELVNKVTLTVNRTPGGPFYINEFKQVVVPVGSPVTSYYAGDYSYPLVFDVDGHRTSGRAIGLDGVPLSPGDPWEGICQGIPYAITANGQDIYYQNYISPTQSRRYFLSDAVGDERARTLAARIRSTKGSAGAHFYINEFRQLFTGIPRIYLGELSAADPWFPRPHSSRVAPAQPEVNGRWLGTASLERRLDPDYYQPVYDEIEELIRIRHAGQGKLVRLSSLCEHVVRGWRNDDHKPFGRTNARIPLASAVGFHLDTLLPWETFLSEDYIEQNGHPLIHSEGVLVNTVGKPGSHFVFYSPMLHGAPVALASSLAFFRIKGEVDPAFLANELNQRYVSLQFQRLAWGAPVSRVGLNDLRSIRVVLPPLPVQDRMAQEVRLRAAVLFGLPPGGPVSTDGKPGATFEEVLDNVETRILEEQWLALDRCRFVEWTTDQRYELTGRVWSLPRARSGVLATKVAISSDIRTWIMQKSQPFHVFNSIGRPGQIEYEAAKGLQLAPQTPAEYISAFLTVLTDLAATPGGIGIDRGTLLRRLQEHRVVRKLIPDGEEVMTAFAQAIRPVLFVGVERHGQPYGAFVLVGPDQTGDSQAIYDRLRSLGLGLSASVRSQLLVLPDIARLAAMQTVTNLMHRVKNPLGSIDTAITFLRKWAEAGSLLDQPVPDAEGAAADAKEMNAPLAEYSVRGYLDRIDRAKAELANLSHKLRVLARAESGGLPGWQPLRIVIDDVLNKTLGQRREVRCEVLRDAVLEQSYEVYADRGLLVDALVNVVDNSLREMRHRPPRLEIRLVSGEEFSRLEIDDNGIEEAQPLIADPFGWGTTGHFTTGKGSGYGLPMVRQTFASVNCRCDLEKHPAGPGCVFWGILPTRKASGE
jgi:signal transduction histidine kinase